MQLAYDARGFLPRVTLGQQVEPLYMIDRVFSESIIDAIDTLLGEKEIPEEWTSEQCWINLRIRRWNEIIEFHKRVRKFLDSTAQKLQVTDSEETLIGQIMICVDTLLKKESESLESTVDFFYTLIGVAGGLIAVGVALGI